MLFSNLRVHQLARLYDVPGDALVQGEPALFVLVHCLLRLNVNIKEFSGGSKILFFYRDLSRAHYRLGSLLTRNDPKIKYRICGLPMRTRVDELHAVHVYQHHGAVLRLRQLLRLLHCDLQQCVQRCHLKLQIRVFKVRSK